MRAGPNVRGKAARGNNLCARRGVRGTVARGTGVRDRVDRRDGVGGTRWSRVKPGRSPDEAYGKPQLRGRRGVRASGRVRASGTSAVARR